MRFNALFLTTQVENVLKLIAAFIVFVIVLMVTYMTTRWIGSYQKTQFSGKNIEYIEGMRLTNNKYIQILRIGQEYVAVAMCKDSITFLTKINKEDLIFDDEANVSPQSFAALFDKVKNMKSLNKDENNGTDKENN